MQQKINHVAIVMDASGSMHHIADEVIKVVDSQVADLATLSTDLDQETRVTLYTFNETPVNVCYDKDVLRMPSLQNHYRPSGQTALIDATLQAQEDLTKTATLYGDHAFLMFVLTDGQENNSRRRAPDLAAMFATLDKDPRWTVAALVPDAHARFKAQAYGFPTGNVAVWNATSTEGVKEVGETMRQATAQYMNSRAAGVTNTKALFSMDQAAVNHKTVSRLKEIVSGIEILPVTAAMDITTFITKHHKRTFRQGKYYFPLVKREKVGPQKNVVVRHKISGKVFGGPEVRTLLGLPDHEVSIKPGVNNEYDVFIQSTSTNRNLVPNHDLLVIE